ncbi:MAG: hypothetical protein NVS9B8_04240 [Candidatus Limnocylindrales bacterium]
MARREERTFCCGAGGGHMWLEEGGNQINEERAREATATGASTLAVACPFCTVMLDDGMRSTGGGLVVKDVATLLVEAVERGRPLPDDDVAAVPLDLAVTAPAGDQDGSRVGA